MSQLNKTTTPWKARLEKNTISLFLWTFAWLCTTALVKFGSKYLWDYDTYLSAAAVILNIVVGSLMILMNKRHLDSSDEMMKKIQLDAMAMSLGIGLVLGLSFQQLEAVKLISFQPQIAHLVMLMSIVYALAVLFGRRKYA
ncbi:MAG: hypothetical protein Q9M92_05220 [Enterobacterales bacterium]|nr:hypothetical protein [Enterobacterales bacterium]